MARGPRARGDRWFRVTLDSPFKMEKESAVPLYVQLAGALEKGVRDGTYPEGARIPSEQELIRSCGVSRVTVRMAMGHLLEKNLIVRKQGRGTFVRKQMITQPMEELFGYYPSLLQKGMKPRTRVLEYQAIAANGEVGESLHLSPEEKVMRFVRQYFLGRNVRVLIEMYIPANLAGHWTKKDAEEKNSFRLLQEHAGLQIGSSSVKIRAARASRELGRLLNVPPRSPVLELRRITYSVQQKPVEYAILHFPGDGYELTATLQAVDWKQVRVGSK